MADFSLGSQATGRLEVWENWNASTQVSYHVKLSIITNNVWNNTGSANWNGNGGGVTGSGNFNYSQYQTKTLWEYDWTYNKDANGYGTWNFYGYINGDNSPYCGAGSTNFNMSPGRIGIAPGIAGITADTIKPTSARLGGEITGYGLGTSANMNMYYRLQGSGTWIDLGNQGDAAGYNYWNVTGLKPGKTYEYVMNVWNNNGDFAQSGVSTFKTKGIAGHTPLLMRLA